MQESVCKMEFGVYLTGAFGQSQAQYEARNEVNRRGGSKEKLEGQIRRDTGEVIMLQETLGLDFVIDPMFKFFYLFQPFSEKVNGVQTGPQENWFNNNLFYWRPQINCPLDIQTGFTENYLHLNELPKNRTAMIVLPSPYTLQMLSDIEGYLDRKAVITNLAEVLHAEAQHLVSKGIGRIQYDEPAIVVKQSLGTLEKEDLSLLQKGLEICGTLNGATTSLNTYFGDAGPLIPYLLSLPVDCIGIDMAETSLKDVLRYKYYTKELALGMVDARNISLEDPKEVAQQLRIVAEKTIPRKLWLTPNTGTEYRGYTHSINKMRLLSQARMLLHE